MALSYIGGRIMSERRRYRVVSVGVANSDKLMNHHVLEVGDGEGSS
jgi:hypothetical protein